MTKIVRWTLAGIAALALVACQTAPPAVTQPPAKMVSGAVVDPAGMTLYTFSKDTAWNNKSECNGPCAKAWPPFSAEGGASPAGDWTIITREDGMRQWAYKGRPLYLYAKDTKPGERSGDNINGLWSWAKQ